MTRTSAEVEEDVVAQRDQLDRTVEALKDKMTPGQLFDEASRAMGGAGQQVLAKFVDQAKENPMPLAVMGLGLAWLMSTSSKGATPSAYGTSAAAYQQTGYTATGVGAGTNGHGGGVGDAVRSLAEKTSGLASSAGHALSDAATSAGQLGQTTASGVKSVAGQIGERASSVGGVATRRAGELLQQEPLIIGALGLFVGLAVGAALPATATENELLGPMHDQILDKGKEIATEKFAQAGDVAKAAFESVKSDLVAADLPGSIHDVVDAGRGALQDHS